MNLYDELDALLVARDRGNMRPTIEALLALEAEHPENARVIYELAGAYDTAGEEATARKYYERALGLGLTGDTLRRCYLQYGSTLRNLGDFDESIRVFERGRQEFPASPSLAVFEALTMHASGRYHEAVAALLETVADTVEMPDIDRYKPAIRGNAAAIRALEGGRGEEGGHGEG